MTSSDVVRAETERALQLAREEKRAAQALITAAQERSAQAEQQLQAAASREYELKKIVQQAEEQVRPLPCPPSLR